MVVLDGDDGNMSGGGNVAGEVVVMMVCVCGHIDGDDDNDISGGLDDGGAGDDGNISGGWDDGEVVVFMLVISVVVVLIVMILFTQPLRSGRISHKVNFLSGVLTGLNSEFFLLLD